MKWVSSITPSRIFIFHIFWSECSFLKSVLFLHDIIVMSTIGSLAFEARRLMLIVKREKDGKENNGLGLRS
jgi:hypothetical protein